jgi:hypothetical protein
MPLRRLRILEREVGVEVLKFGMRKFTSMTCVDLSRGQIVGHNNR